MYTYYGIGSSSSASAQRHSKKIFTRPGGEPAQRRRQVLGKLRTLLDVQETHLERSGVGANNFLDLLAVLERHERGHLTRHHI